MKRLFLLVMTLTTLTTTAQVAVDNARLTTLFQVDQKAREGESIDWAKLNLEDAQRRNDVHRMLAAGDVRTATDYFHAALIYQHGDKPDDYMLAHTLAVTSISLGGKQARWLAAATLDRYVRSLGKPQIYGTQFKTDEHGVWSHEETDANLITDSMRAASCVVSSANQRAILEKVKAGGKFESTSIAPCPTTAAVPPTAVAKP